MSLLVLWSAALLKHSYINTRPHDSNTAAVTEAAVAAAQAGGGLSSAPPLQADDPAGSGSSSSGPAGRLRSSLWDDVYQVAVLSFGENFPQAQGKLCDTHEYMGHKWHTLQA
jgi:hypothetical protein